MLDRLKSIEERYEKLNELLSDPEVVNDPKKLREYSKEQSDIQETVDVYRQYRDASEQLADAKAMLEEKLDAEMRDMVKEEISELQKETETLSERLKVLLIRKILMTTKTLSWRSAGLREARKPLYSRAICTECIPVMLSFRAGKQRSWKRM